MKRAHTTFAAVLLSSLVLADASSHGDEPDAAPRYKLQPGQEIVYEGSYEFRHQSGMHTSTATTTFWISGVNPNGGWHLIARCESAFTQSFGDSGTRKPQVRKEDRVGTFDLLPNCQKEFGKDYAIYAAALTGMSLEEFAKYERGRRAFCDR